MIYTKEKKNHPYFSVQSEHNALHYVLQKPAVPSQKETPAKTLISHSAVANHSHMLVTGVWLGQNVHWSTVLQPEHLSAFRSCRRSSPFSPAVTTALSKLSFSRRLYGRELFMHPHFASLSWKITWAFTEKTVEAVKVAIGRFSHLISLLWSANFVILLL